MFDITKVPAPSYFPSLCHEIFDSFMLVHGFATVQLKGRVSTGVVYGNGLQVISFGYTLEDYPAFRVLVALGLLHEERLNVEEFIALGDLMPATQGADYWNWTFADRDELISVLTRIRDQLLPEHVFPFWEAPEHLRQSLTRTRNTREARNADRGVQKQRCLAEEAFRDGRYEETIAIYEALSPVDLSPADAKRLAISRKHQSHS